MCMLPNTAPIALSLSSSFVRFGQSSFIVTLEGVEPSRPKAADFKSAMCYQFHHKVMGDKVALP